MVIGNEAEHQTKCPECQQIVEIKVLHSAAGYYLGTECNYCGPVGRESDYFRSFGVAAAELEIWKSFNVKPNARTPGYWG